MKVAKETITLNME